MCPKLQAPFRAPGRSPRIPLQGRSPIFLSLYAVHHLTVVVSSRCLVQHMLSIRLPSMYCSSYQTNTSSPQPLPYSTPSHSPHHPRPRPPYSPFLLLTYEPSLLCPNRNKAVCIPHCRQFQTPPLSTIHNDLTPHPPPTHHSHARPSERVLLVASAPSLFLSLPSLFIRRPTQSTLPAL